MENNFLPAFVLMLLLWLSHTYVSDTQVPDINCGANGGKFDILLYWGGVMYAEYYMLQWCGVNNHVSYLFATAAFSWFLFLWVLQYKGPLPCAAVEIGKRHSANIYYYHSAVGAVAMMLSSICPWLKMVGAPVVFLFSFLFSVFLLRVTKVIGKKLMYRD